MKKRAQAAMEFLMTYGWAILAAVIVVGVLWYMIGNPANLAGNNFQVSAPFVGNAMSIDTSNIQLEVRNGDASSVEINFVNVSAGGCTANTDTTSVSAGGLTTITIPCTLTSGDRLNADVTIQYLKSGSSLNQTATGSITARVP